VAAGWEVVGTSATSEFHEGFALSSWLTVASSGLTVGKGDVTFDVTENDTDAKRVGYIHLVAGRLHLAVKIVQRFVEVWIEGASELVFEPSLGVFSGQTFQVKWLPAGARVSAASIPSSGYPTFSYDNTPPNDAPGDDFSDPAGERNVTFCPAVLTAAEIAANPYAVRASIARFVAFYNDDFASADIELRQINYHIVPDADAISNSGNIHSFPVRSNTKWKVKPGTLSDPDGILDATYESTLLAQSGDYNTSSGNIFNLKLVNDAVLSKNGGVTLILTDPTNRAADVLVSIYKIDCGKNGIPVRQQIGNNHYLTYAYGSKCWMVENSKEGTYSGGAYGYGASGSTVGTITYNAAASGEVCGYYYTRAQAVGVVNACPTGWHIFTLAEATELTTAVNNDSSGVGKWWTKASSGALAGYYYPIANPVMPEQWRNFGIHGTWWGDGDFTLHHTADIRNDVFTETMQSSRFTYYWFSVRCVQN
jgi:uncharacterized protein (TIGR02145 family)